MPIKILNAESREYSRTAYKKLCDLGDVIELDCTREKLLESLHDIEVLIVRLANKIDDEVMSHAPNLRVIVTATTGLNHMDIDAAKKRGITILSLKGEREFLDSLTATAELTCLLADSLQDHSLHSRKIVRSSWLHVTGS